MTHLHTAAPENDGHRPSWRRTPVIVASVGVALVASASFAYAGARTTVSLDVDGEVTTVTTTAGSVDGLLAEQGVDVGSRDLVAPGGDTALAEGGDVVVRSAEQVTVDADGKTKDVWTTALDADEALATFADRSGAGDVSLVASRSDADGRSELPLTLDENAPVEVVVDGDATVVDDGAVDVDAALKDAGVTVDSDDRVTVERADEAKAAETKAASTKAAETKAASTKAAETKAAATAAPTADTATDAPTSGAATSADAESDTPVVSVVVERVETKKKSTTAAVEHGTKTVKDPDRYADEGSKVTTKGKDGVRTTVATVTTVDGKVETSKKVSSKITTKPVTEVVTVGTKARPAPTPKTNREVGQELAAARGWSGSEYQCLEQLWTRESGWSTTADNPTSSAYGIPQALPGSKMASAGSDWATNPATQIAWGLDYIASSYGTPCGAWSHSQATGWY